MSAFDAYVRLDGSLDGFIRCDEPMAKHTTYRIGGPAALYVYCETYADLTLSIEVLSDEDVKWTVVGKGSNLLVADEGYDGAVIVLGGEFSRIDFGGYKDTDDDGNALKREDLPPCVKVVAGAGATLSRLVQKAFGLGLGGLEFAVGTPGSVGGAVRMNAGTGRVWMSSCIDYVTVYRLGRGLVRLDVADVDWGYRVNTIPEDAIIVEVCLNLHPLDKIMLRASMEASLKRRRASQPLSQPSCGSVFRGTDVGPAGQLLEACGLKGLQCGGAQISPVHANFIVNTGNASAQDVLELMRIAQSKVREKYGVELRPEVKFLGFSQR